MSASSTPTRSPRSTSAAAMLAVSVDLPTPPLPDATATTRVAGSSRILAARGGRRGAGSRARPSPRAHHVEVERDARDALDAADVPRDLVLEARPERAARHRERDRHVDVASARDDDVAHHLELGHGPLELGVDHELERLQDRVAVGVIGQRSLSAWPIRAPGSPISRSASRCAAGLPVGRPRSVKVRGRRSSSSSAATEPTITVKLVESCIRTRCRWKALCPTGYGLGKAGWVTVPVSGLVACDAQGLGRGELPHRGAEAPRRRARRATRAARSVSSRAGWVDGDYASAKTVAQSSFMLTTVQPSSAARSSAVSAPAT